MADNKDGELWIVERENGEPASRFHGTREEAEDRARDWSLWHADQKYRAVRYTRATPKKRQAGRKGKG